VTARLITIATVVVIGAHLAVAILLWPDLPRRVPVHLDLQGQPTRWTNTSLLSWLAPWMFATATALFLLGMVLRARRSPILWNVPNKESFLALPLHFRRVIEARLQRLLAAIALFCALCFAGVHFGLYRAAMGISPGPAFWALTFLPLLAIFGVAVRESRVIGEEIRTFAARASTER
jgi:uncharacterized membrane protein